MIGKLAERAARDLLATQNTGRLACCWQNEPYVVPVHYLFEGDAAFIRISSINLKSKDSIIKIYILTTPF